MKKKFIVMGSGFGGLAIALRLLVRGFDVTVLERREKVGGRAYQIKDSGYTFDLGPSLITVPDLFDELFGLFNKRREDYVQFIQIDPFYRIYFDQGKDSAPRFEKIDYTGDEKMMLAELSRYEIDSERKYHKFFSYTKKIYDAAYVQLGAQPFLKLADFLKVLPQMMRLNALRSVVSTARHYFSSDLVRRMYSFHPLFIGTNPQSAPSALSFIPYLEREGGVHFAKGGMYSVVEALQKLFVEHGGKVVCNSEVTSLVTDATGSKIVSVTTSVGKNYECDAVVSNGDIYKTHSMLSRKNVMSRFSQIRWRHADYSMSLYMFYFGLKKQYHTQLAHHTLFLGKEYESLLTEVFSEKVFPTSLSMYLHIPSVTDPEMAPEGCESMYVLVPVPNLSGSVIWSDAQHLKMRNWVIDYLEFDFGLSNFRESIEVEHRFSPENFSKDLLSLHGAAFGPQLSLFQSIYFRQHNKSGGVGNLYFVGAGTHPGPGVPGVLKTAECTMNIITNDFA